MRFHTFESFGAGTKRLLLLLDLDHTLIDAHNGSPRDRVDFKMYGAYGIAHRPYAPQFLDFAFQHFRVGVFTARPEEDAMEIVRGFGYERRDFAAFLTEQDCDFTHGDSLPVYVKDLEAHGFDLATTLIVDDVPEGGARNADNLITIDPYDNRHHDEELWRLMHYLDTIKDVGDVTDVDKSRWWLHKI